MCQEVSNNYGSLRWSPAPRESKVWKDREGELFAWWRRNRAIESFAERSMLSSKFRGMDLPESNLAELGFVILSPLKVLEFSMRALRNGPIICKL